MEELPRLLGVEALQLQAVKFEVSDLGLGVGKADVDRLLTL